MNQTRGKFQKTCRKPRGRTQQIFIPGGYARLFGFQIKTHGTQKWEPKPITMYLDKVISTS